MRAPGQLVLDAAFKVGTWSSLVESAAEREAHEQRVEEFKAKVARGEIESDAERMQREDAELVAAHEGRDLVKNGKYN